MVDWLLTVDHEARPTIEEVLANEKMIEKIQQLGYREKLLLGDNKLENLIAFYEREQVSLQETDTQQKNLIKIGMLKAIASAR